MRLVATVTVAACALSCGAPRAPEPITVPAPQSPPAPAPVASAPMLADAGASDPSRLVYRRGVRWAGHEDSSSCWAKPGDDDACKTIRPGARCQLQPWPAHVGPCRGAAWQPGDDGPRADTRAERCACTCSAEYVRAADEQSRAIQACGNVP